MRFINFQNKKIINKKEKILLISGLIMLISFLGILGEIDRAEVQAADCSSSFTAVSGDGPDITQSGNDWCGWNTPPGCTGDPCDTYVGSGSYSFCSGNTMQSFECTCSLLTGCNCTNFTEQTCGSCADAQYIYASDTYQPALCLPTTTTITTTTTTTPVTTTTTTPTTTTTTTVPPSSTGCGKASTTSYDFPTETGSCIDDAGWCGGETIPVAGYGTYADDCDDYCTDNGWVDGGDYSIPNCDDSFVTCGSSCTPDSDYKCCICKCKKATTTTTTTTTAPGPTTTTAPGPTTTTAPGPTTTTAPSGPVWPVTFSNPINATTFEELIVSIINWLLAIIGSIVLLFIIIGGIMYMTAAGNEEQIKRAKRILFYTILGFAVVLISYSLIQEIKKILGI